MVPPDDNTITGIILAGGKSSRMKTEKGLVPFAGKPLIQHVIEAVRKITDNIIIITKNPGYAIFGFTCFPDIIPDKGALGGIYSGLVHSRTEKNIVVGCDMPFLSATLFQKLIDHSKDADAVVSIHKNLEEPLSSLYNKSCIPHFKQLLDQDRLKITDALEELKIIRVSFDAESWFTGKEFTNLNSPDQLTM